MSIHIAPTVIVSLHPFHEYTRRIHPDSRERWLRMRTRWTSPTLQYSFSKISSKKKGVTFRVLGAARGNCTAGENFGRFWRIVNFGVSEMQKLWFSKIREETSGGNILGARSQKLYPTAHVASTRSWPGGSCSRTGVLNIFKIYFSDIFRIFKFDKNLTRVSVHTPPPPPPPHH